MFNGAEAKFLHARQKKDTGLFVLSASSERADNISPPPSFSTLTNSNSPFNCSLPFTAVTDRFAGRQQRPEFINGSAPHELRPW